MKKIIAIVLIFLSLQVQAQSDTGVIRLEKKLAITTSIGAQLEILNQLATKTVYENQEKCQAYLDKGIFLAEQSRDREMMVKARLNAVWIYAINDEIKSRQEKAKAYLLEALDICKTEKGLFPEKVLCNMTMAREERNAGRANEALKYNNIAIDFANETEDDSLKVMSLIGLGNTQLKLDENLNAFKTYIQAETIAEKSNHPNKDWLQVMVYSSFERFYVNIEDYDKAIDYDYKALAYAKKNNNIPDILNNLNSIGQNYINAKKYEVAKGTYEELIRISDSLKNNNYKISGVIGILNTMIFSPDKTKAISYLRQHPEINELINKMGIGYELDKGIAEIYSLTNQVDSANFYFEKAMPEIEKKGNIFKQIEIFQKYGTHLFKSGNYDKAITYLLKAKALNDSSNSLSNNVTALAFLDSCYQNKGDFKNAFIYNNLWQKAKTELDEKSKAKDVLALEIDAENKHKERIEKENIENTRQRHNWQYMAILLSIITLFILLAAFGLLNVPIKWVRGLGFISFIFFFEFIILLADNWIHEFTQGEPWKVILIKVALIAMLLPLHHYLEEKVIHYIIHRKNKKKVLSNITTKQIIE